MWRTMAAFVLVGCVQRADAFPLCGVGLEIGGCLGGACFAHGGKPLQVGFENGRLRGGDTGDRFAEGGALAFLARAIKHPAAFLEAFEQLRLAQQLKMSRDSRLALAHDLYQFADRQLRLPQKQQEAQAGRVARGTEHGNQAVQVDLQIDEDINISLYHYAIVTQSLVSLNSRESLYKSRK